MFETATLPTLLAFAITILGLSLLVQVLQEIYKYLTSSKATTYRRALSDFLGPDAEELLKPESIPELRLRDPFRFLRRRPSGHLQPLDQPELVAALERTSAPWIRRALEALDLETRLQAGTPRTATPALRNLMAQLRNVDPNAPDFATAKEVETFLLTWLNSEWPDREIVAPRIHRALRHRFLPVAIRVETHFGQFMKNFETAYRRRNLRQTFLIGLALAVTFRLPARTLYQSAALVPVDQTIAIVEYLFWCLVTALLISFGAPFWNDLAGALLRLARGAVPARRDRGEEPGPTPSPTTVGSRGMVPPGT